MWTLQIKFLQFNRLNETLHRTLRRRLMSFHNLKFLKIFASFLYGEKMKLGLFSVPAANDYTIVAKPHYFTLSQWTCVLTDLPTSYSVLSCFVSWSSHVTICILIWNFSLPEVNSFLTGQYRMGYRSKVMVDYEWLIWVV